MWDYCVTPMLNVWVIHTNMLTAIPAVSNFGVCQAHARKRSNKATVPSITSIAIVIFYTSEIQLYTRMPFVEAQGPA